MPRASGPSCGRSALPEVKKTFPRVALILGEPEVADARAREILAASLAPERQDLDLDVIRAGQDPLERVEPALSQVGMFGDERAVWVRGLGAEAEAETERLLKFLTTGLSASAILVVTAVRVDQRSRLFKWFTANANVEDLGVEMDKRGRMQEEDVDRFIRDRIAATGLPVPAASVVALIRGRSGADLGSLARELEKLCLACAAKGAVTAVDVRTHVRDQAEAWVFDLTNAISERHLGRAGTLLSQLLRQGEPPLRLVAVLAGHVADLIEAARALPAVPAAALRNSGAFARDYFPKLPPEVRNRFRSGIRAYYVFQGASAYRLDELRSIHRSLVDADLALKSSRLAPEHLLTQIVQRACGSRAH